MRVLFISYYFPPDTAVGGMRAARFASRLHRHGIQASVLTGKDGYRDKIDTRGNPEMKGVNIYQSSQTPGIRSAYLSFKKNILGKDLTHPTGPTPWSGTLTVHEEGALKRLKRYFLSLFIALPDEQKNWILPATLKAVRVVRARKIDCIISTSPPHSAHLVGYLTKRLTGVRWIADFRDPWVDTLTFKSPELRSALSDALERRMEKAVIAHADRTITTTMALERVLKQRYAGRAGKISCIPNGINSELISEVESGEKFREFTITYTGTLYAGRTPEPVFRAVREMLNEGAIKAGDIRIKLVGDCSRIEDLPTDDLVRSYGLEELVEITGQVPYRDAIGVMKRSHLLLLLAPGLPLQVPAKVYDYFGCGVTILAISEPGSATSEIVESTGAGRCFGPDETGAIKEYILKNIKADTGGLDGNFSENAKEFDLGLLTERLAGEIRGLVGLAAHKDKAAAYGARLSDDV